MGVQSASPDQELVLRHVAAISVESVLFLSINCVSSQRVCQCQCNKGLRLPTIKKDQVRMEPTVGQRSDFLVRHLQELRIHVPGTFPFWVEEELVIAAISTNRCVTQRSESESVNSLVEGSHQAAAENNRLRVSA